jgi:excisionase family DNA binding protein
MDTIVQDDGPRLLTVGEVARVLAVSSKTVRRRIATGELAAVRLGRGPKAPLRVDPEAVAELVDRGGSR